MFQVKIVVLDSLTMCLLALSDTLERTRYLASVIKKFRTLAQKHSFAVSVIFIYFFILELFPSHYLFVVALV